MSVIFWTQNMMLRFPVISIVVLLLLFNVSM